MPRVGAEALKQAGPVQHLGGHDQDAFFRGRLTHGAPSFGWLVTSRQVASSSSGTKAAALSGLLPWPTRADATNTRAGGRVAARGHGPTFDSTAISDMPTSSTR